MPDYYMLVRSLSLLSAALLVSLCLYLALSARQAVFAPDRANPFVASVYLAPEPQYRTARPRVTAPPNPAAPSLQPVAPAPIPPQVIDVVNPVWLALPRHPERRYPREAFAADVEGAVELDCMVEPDGRLACAIASETPRGWGFGEAALALSREHVMAPLSFQGAPARGRYRMRVPFTQSRS